MNLPHGEVVLSAPFSLRGTNSSFGEFTLPFGDNFLPWRICYTDLFLALSPSPNFFLMEDLYKLQHVPFFNLSIRTRQYLGTHTFHGESFPAFLDSINALKSKLVVLIEATGRKVSLSIVIASFLLGNLSIPLLIMSCMTFLKPPICINGMVP